MALDAKFLLDALLRRNFLPNQRKDKEEIPPILTSNTFTPDVARDLASGDPRNRGYDTVEYKLTRFDGVSRACSIPHPVAYAHLALCLHEHWQHLDYITHNPNSIIKPQKYPDGRMAIMSYDTAVFKKRQVLANSYGKRFVAQTDISNCFPSIYSHAIPWALVGHHHAKQAKNQRDEWFNMIDAKVRLAKRGETKGIAIGPGTSNVLSELILAKVDDAMRSDFPNYMRYIDDYTAYCDTEKEAREFIARLSRELSRFELHVNERKTSVRALPEAMADDWLTTLALELPVRTKPSTSIALSYLDKAVHLSRQSPDGSVLKYALKSLLGKQPLLANDTDVFRYALNLAYHQPVLVPVLEQFFRTTESLAPFQRFAPELQQMAQEHAEQGRTDATSWSLYYHHRLDVGVEEQCARAIVESRDCVPLLLLYTISADQHREWVVDAMEQLDVSDAYELDQYWLLRYEMFVEDEPIEFTDDERRVFEVLKSAEVRFVDTAAKGPAAKGEVEIDMFTDGE